MRAMEPRIQYAKTSDGVSIAFTVLGSGTETLVSAPNIWGDLHLYKAMPAFRAYFDILADRGRRVVIYDSRGMGSSEHRDSDYSDHARLTDLEAVIDRVGLDHFNLYGFLHGSHLATAYTVAHPDRVKHLVLSQPFVRGIDFYTAVPEMATIIRMDPATPEEEDIVGLSRSSILTGFTDPDLAAQLSSAMSSSMSPSETAAFGEATRRSDIGSLLTQILVPTLVVFTHSFLPGVLPLTREVARLVPGAELIETGEQGETLVYRGIDALDAIDTFLRGGQGEESAHRDPESVEAGAFRTILFTDVEGSTALTDRLGDAKARDLLREHERITREALKEHGGSEVKTLGDGFMASFSSATKALECSIAIQQAFAERNESAEEPIKVRIGLNAGEPIAEDDPGGRGDLFGTAVNMAARIAAKADGGEILASNVVRELVAGKEFLFSDRGDTELRGFEEAVRVFEVRWRE